MLNNKQGIKEEKTTINVLKEYFRFYCNFKGRLNRKNLFLFILESIGMVALLLSVFLAVVVFDKDNKVLLITSGAILAILAMILGIASSSVAVKRLHDLNLSGWWVFLSLPFDFFWRLEEKGVEVLPPVISSIVTGIGVIVVFGFIIVLWFKKGTKGENKYGLDFLQIESPNVPRIPKKIIPILIMNLPIIIFLFYKMAMVDQVKS